MNFLKKLDIFPKYSEPEVKVKTVPGALMSIFTVLMMSILFFHEFYRFVKPRYHSEITVDTSRIGLHRTIPVNFNVTVAAPCSRLHVDAYDFEGNQQVAKAPEIRSHRIDENGYSIDSNNWVNIKKKELKGREQKRTKSPKNECGSCYGAGEPGQCCNSCDSVIEAFKKKGWGLNGIDRWAQCVEEGYASLGKESCNIDGRIHVNHASGEFHIALTTEVRLGQKKPVDVTRISKATNLSHTVHYVEFGPSYPSIRSPLNEIKVLQEDEGKMVYRYNLFIVPMKIITKRGFVINSFEYTPMISRKNITEPRSRIVPGIYFSYDLASYSLVQRETCYTFWQFITSVLAIVGGAFTCAQLADQFFFRAYDTIEGKRNIGKLN